MNEIYLKLKKDIQALTLAGVHLDKKFETKINKLIESVDIKEAKDILNDINAAIATLDTKFTELTEILANNKNLPNDVKNLQTKVSTLETSVKDNSTNITTLDSRISQNLNDITLIKGDISSINTKIDSLNSNLSTTNDNVTNLQRIIGENTTSIENINKITIPDLQSQINENKSDINSLENIIQGNHQETEMIFLDIYKKLGKTHKTVFNNVSKSGIKSNNTIIEKQNLEDPVEFDGLTSLLFYLSGSFTISSEKLSIQELNEILSNNLEFYYHLGETIVIVSKLKLTSIFINGKNVTGTYYCEFLSTNHTGPISIYFNSSKSYSDDISWSANFVLDRYGIPNSQ